MIFSEQKKLDEIEDLALQVCGLIALTKDACEINNYFNELIALEYVLKLQEELIVKIEDWNISLTKALAGCNTSNRF